MRVVLPQPGFQGPELRFQIFQLPPLAFRAPAADGDTPQKAGRRQKQGQSPGPELPRGLRRLPLFLFGLGGVGVVIARKGRGRVGRAGAGRLRPGIPGRPAGFFRSEDVLFGLRAGCRFVKAAHMLTSCKYVPNMGYLRLSYRFSWFASSKNQESGTFPRESCGLSRGNGDYFLWKDLQSVH